MRASTISGVVAAAVGSLLLIWVIGGLQRPDRPDAVAGLGVLASPSDVYDPVRAGEETPTGFRQLLSRDAIVPVYDPTFLPAAQSPWSDNTLVIGVEVDGEAKAYPVSFLNRREMVIDRLAGEPLLVSW